MLSFLPFLSAADVAPSALLIGQYTPWIVALSLAMAVLAAIAALQIAGVTQASQGRLSRTVAIVSATFVLGAGIWSMHFIGMLAFQLCAPVTYLTAPTLLSMLPGLAAAFVAVLMITRTRPSRAQRGVSGALIGVGIAAMHYSGMSAMHLAPELHYDPQWFVISLVVGVGLSVLALQVQGGLSRLRWLSQGRANIVGGVVLGLAITGTHYVGMRAALFIGQADPTFVNTVLQTELVLEVALVALLVIGTVGSVWGLLHYRMLANRLRHNEQRLQSVIEGTVEGIVVLDAGGHMYRFNRSAECVTGHRAQDVLGRRFTSLLMQPDPMLDAYLAGAPLPDGSAAGSGIVRELVLRGPDGRPQEVRVSIGAVDAAGDRLFVAFLSDIGEQKRTERALREREAQNGALVRNIPGAFFRLAMNPKRTAVFVSEQIRAILGFEAAEFLQRGRSLHGLIHPDDLGRLRAITGGMVNLPGRHDFRAECRMQHADGSHRWVSLNCEIDVPVDGSTPWMDGVIIDITESKLRAAEFEGTVRAIGHSLAVIEFDVAGRVIGANENFLAISGYTRDEVLGQSHALFCDPAYVRSPAYADFWATLKRGEFHLGEYERFGKSGCRVWLNATYNPVTGADGRLLKIVKFATDVTAQRAVQEALREAKDRAEQASAARTAFLANMSHEIRTPMNAVIGFTELLLDTPLNPVQRRHLDTVRHSAGSLLGLLNGILDTAKLEKGAMELELRDFSLRELATQVSDSLRIGAQSKQVDLLLDYADGLGDHFRGDAMRLRQVLVNLVSNAVKFTDQGAVRVVVRRQEGTLGDVDRTGMVALHIAVHDTGIGIAADRLDTIFQPFAQADASMSRRFGGTGLGITIARQLVELMGGAIAVDSRLGEGSVFHVYLSLPVADPAQPGTAAAADPAPADEVPLSVLVVDDVRQNAELVSMALSAFGHTAAIASEGAEAVRLWSEGSFDLVLMDVHMPGMDGREAARRIRAAEAASGRQRTPIVALTASVLDEDRRAARDVGMDGFVAKPIDLEQLRREMVRAMEADAALHAQPVPMASVPTAPPSAGVHALPEAAAAAELPQEPAAPTPAGAASAPAATPAPPTRALDHARAALDALLRGEIDGAALAATDLALRQRGDAAMADLLDATVAEFDFERAATLLNTLLNDSERIAA